MATNVEAVRGSGRAANADSGYRAMQAARLAPLVWLAVLALELLWLGAIVYLILRLS